MKSIIINKQTQEMLPLELYHPIRETPNFMWPLKLEIWLVLMIEMIMF